MHTALKHRVDLDEVLILGQGIDGQRRQLLKSFEEAERPLLLGTSSFWEGIDVPGERLSCVIVVRLPFAGPDRARLRRARRAAARLRSRSSRCRRRRCG